MSPWEYTLANLLSDSATQRRRSGNGISARSRDASRIDQGFDEWWGIKNTTDEAAYSSYALYRAVAEETGIEAPKCGRPKGAKG